MKILVIMQGYLLGKKYGGPPISIDNLCRNIREYEWYIIARDHDLHESSRYKDISYGWNAFADRNGEINCGVRYLSDRNYGYKGFKKIIDEIDPDLIYF